MNTPLNFMTIGAGRKYLGYFVVFGLMVISYLSSGV